MSTGPRCSSDTGVTLRRSTVRRFQMLVSALLGNFNTGFVTWLTGPCFLVILYIVIAPRCALQASRRLQAMRWAVGSRVLPASLPRRRPSPAHGAAASPTAPSPRRESAAHMARPGESAIHRITRKSTFDFPCCSHRVSDLFSSAGSFFILHRKRGRIALRNSEITTSSCSIPELIQSELCCVE